MEAGTTKVMLVRQKQLSLVINKLDTAELAVRRADILLLAGVMFLKV